MDTIESLYKKARSTPSDIYEHIPVHAKLAEECDSVVEFGVGSMVSTWGLLHGLKPGGKYTGVDLDMPPVETFTTAKRLAEEKGINFNFIARDDMTIQPEEIGEADMIFIDSMHTYCHLTYELETFSHLAKKYLTFHDSSAPWGEMDDNEYTGDRSEYPAWYDKSKRGVWTAIKDFLSRHPEWYLKERRTNCHGFTILSRCDTTSNVHGIAFSIPEEKIVKELPRNKIRMMSKMIPGKLETYIYNTEEEYYKQYQESFFALTMKKNGWDCLRHYEIIANGCLPVFKDIEQCPARTLTLYPKELQLEANQLYSTHLYFELDDPEFLEKYYNLLQRMISYLREHLTTKKVAKYVLGKSGNSDAKNVLFLSGETAPDYLRCLTLHGFKALFDAQCHDYPIIPHIYEGCNRDNLYGKGITYSGLINPGLHNFSIDNYYTIRSLIEHHYFDIVIFGSMTRGMMLYNTVLSTYKSSEIIFLNGEDESLILNGESKHPLFVRSLI